ncbi:NMT1/THI5-like [Pleurostoma richardsiae]|uniref:NMT1/THI5-like n=1 Tax=Pleurostoma richardsiae TaxID=41990 RepID=A0AA38R635_9PEZI|nr:NMT1/THI5-like [Pleurostoma richardsiae]
MTHKVHLTFACGPYDRMDAIAHGEVQTAGIDLDYVMIEHPRDIFDRMIRGMEFDASEMSSSEYICRYAAGERDLVAIPVFTSRAFRQSCVVVDSDIVTKPSDLNGKRVGVQLYTMTAAVWIRGLLQDAGVDLSSITWVEGDIMKPGPHGNAKAQPLCRPVKRIPNEDNSRGLSRLLEDGELVATIGAEPAPCLGKAPNLQQLFPNIRETEKKYYQDTGIFPIMHLVVIKRKIVEQYPFVPTSLFHAMNESRKIGLRRMKFQGTYRYMLPFMSSDLREIDELFGGDPWPYGIEPNRNTLEALVSFLHDQGMIPDKIPVEDLFAPINGQNLTI